MTPVASPSRSIRSPVEAGAELEPESVVLALEPAGAEAEDHPPVADVVSDRGRHLGHEPGVAERVDRDHVAEAGRDS